MKNILFALLILCFITLAQEKSNTINTTAPNFQLENIEGDIIELNEITGEGPVLLAFWATWCKPCVDELKHYNKLYKKLKSDGFKLIGISTDNERSIAKVKPFVKSKKFEFEILYDTNSEVAKSYYAYNVPFTVIINKEGKIIYSHLGYKKGDEKKVEEIISSLL